jgi:predicted transcriptional regulator
VLAAKDVLAYIAAMDTNRPQVEEPIAPEWQAEAEEQRRLAAQVDAANPHMAEIWHQRTLRALADVDAGRLIDDEDMQAWAESLGTDHQLPEPQPR